MKQYSDELKMSAVRYYYTQGKRSLAEVCNHFHIDVNGSEFTAWRVNYAKEAVRYHREQDCTISEISKRFGVDHAIVVYWIKKYEDEIIKEDALLVSKSEFQNMQEEIRNLRAELSEIKAVLYARG